MPTNNIKEEEMSQFFKEANGIICQEVGIEKYIPLSWVMFALGISLDKYANAKLEEACKAIIVGSTEIFSEDYRSDLGINTSKAVSIINNLKK